MIIPSSTGPFGFRSPDSMALLIIPSEDLSLILPPGFMNSHFAKMRPGPVVYDKILFGFRFKKLISTPNTNPAKYDLALTVECFQPDPKRWMQFLYFQTSFFEQFRTLDSGSKDTRSINDSILLYVI